jgi:transcriptional regulator with XRE-family HTH domain
LSLAELGALTLVHDGYLAAVERAEVEPSLRTMARIATGLGLPLSRVVVRYEEWLAGARDEWPGRGAEGGRK